MASKKLKRAAKVAAGIGAAYLASQALGKKKPVKKVTKISDARSTKISDARRMSNQAAQEDASTAAFANANKPAATYENVPASKFLSTPGGFSRATPEQVNEQMDAFGPMAKEGKFISKKMMSGGSVVARGNKLARSKPTKLF
jgi:hypothetical protein